jgi:hypothetical protein
MMPIHFNKIKEKDPVGIFLPNRTESFFKRRQDENISYVENFKWERQLPNGLFEQVMKSGSPEEIATMKKLLMDEFSRCINNMLEANIFGDKERLALIKQSLESVYAVCEIEVNYREILQNFANPIYIKK